MVKVQIWHSTDFANSSFYGLSEDLWSNKKALEAYHSDVYDLAGELEIDETLSSIEILELAYTLSQNINDHWNKDKPCRSTSVGDIVQFNNSLYIVAPCGFEKLS